MKNSQNQYAETFLKTMGAATGTPRAAAGRAAVQTTLQAWGVQPVDLIQRDGSGLSRYDYVTPEALATILVHVYRDDRLRGPFEATLPIAGRDGSLANRMKGTPAEGNARAKTGSMSNVRGLSGYVTTADGEPLVFSIIANNFDPGFFVEHFIKDMGIALEEAKRMKLSLPGLALAHQLYISLSAHGQGRCGTQALLLALANISGIDWNNR